MNTAETGPSSQHFKIHGMDCGEEVAALKRELGPLVGGAEHLSFDLLNAKMTVQGRVAAKAIIEAVAKTGMRAQEWQEKQDSVNAESFWSRRGRTVMTVLSAVCLLAGFLFHAWSAGGIAGALGSEGLAEGHAVPLFSQALYLLGILSGGWYIFPKAYFSLRKLRPDMNLLMTIAVIGAVGIGEWFEAATVAFLFAFSLLLESWSIGRARRAVAALLDLAPATARVKHADGSEEEVRPEDVPVGTTFIVHPGERIALDGQVAKGMSDVNQAPITGESMPVAKQAGGEVFAGTINGDGVLEICSTKAASDTTLAHIIRLVGEAQTKRAPSEHFVEKFSRIYTPAIMALALAVFLVPPVLFGGEWGTWFYRSLVLLVIGCPCALVISTPVSIVASLAAAARNGVLVKGGLYIELPARLRAIAFDKTGTLTEGKPKVMRVLPLNGHTEKELLGIAAAMEARSDHPLARAIVAYAKEQGVTVKSAEDVRIIQGKGAHGLIDGKEYWLGSHRYLEERGQETEEVHQALAQLTDAGHTIVALGDETHVCGCISLADAVRKESKQAVQALRASGIPHLVMLTGDNRGTANAIAKETDVDEVHAELLPQDKVSIIETLVSRYGAVAMIGDGVNDAPAMARATLGIAMGAAGSDAAIETADIALMSDDLQKLPWLIRHSKRALFIIRQNIIFSLSVKLLFVILTFTGYASLWSAITADMGASLLVVFNALRLLRSSTHS